MSVLFQHYSNITFVLVRNNAKLTFKYHHLLHIVGMVKLTKFQKGVSNLGAKVFNMLPSNIKMESDNPMKFKMALQNFL